jgi:hypothetical protein
VVSASSKYPRRQHHVPRLLLRGFVRGKGKRLFAFDKLEDRTFVGGIGDVGAESYFYDMETPEGTLTLDPSLTRLEGDVASLIDRVRRDRTIAGLSSPDRTALATFVVVQYHRGPGLRAQTQHMMEMLRDVLRKMTAGAQQISPQIQGLMTIREGEAKQIAMRMTANPGPFVPHVLSKEWGLFTTTSDKPFLISDQPVVMGNALPSDPLSGNLGFAVQGIEIYLPITECLCLGFLCAEMTGDLRTHARKAGFRANSNPFLATLAAGSLSDYPVAMTPDMVRGLNSLQVCASERFLYSGVNDFTFVREFIVAQPSARQGMRSSIVSPPMGKAPEPKREADLGNREEA